DYYCQVWDNTIYHYIF
nr:immunoglobulin light chain junction region [Macaca mulatta]